MDQIRSKSHYGSQGNNDHHSACYCKSYFYKLVDFLSFFERLRNGGDAVVEHKGKDQIRKEVSKVFYIEEGIPSIRSECLNFPVLAHNDESSKDHEEDWNKPDSDCDDLQWFSLGYALEGKCSPRNEEKAEPEFEGIQDSHIGKEFGEGLASHNALRDGNSKQIDGYGQSRK